MRLKANLHFHSQDDPEGWIPHTFFEGIKKASSLGFEVIALTCHNKVVNNGDYVRYASDHNVLLIPGIELSVKGKHVVVLNASPEIEKVESFEELAGYKRNHPEILVLAPHPFFYGWFSLKESLEKHIELFDAVEYSWFYSKWFNRNKKGGAVAERHDIPFIATSDSHSLDFIDESYAVIDAEEKTVPAVLEAVKGGRFRNVSAPRKFWREMVWHLLASQTQNILKSGRRKN